MTTAAPTSDILRKVQGLLAKAEGTDYEAERDAFLAKAQEMMERYAIDAAQLEAAKPGTEREPVSLFVAWPARTVGKSAKGSLAVTIAQSNRCQVKSEYRWVDGKRTLGLLFQGMPEDAEFCMMLYTSLGLQAEQAYDPRKKPEWTNGRTYRANFYEGYCSRVSDLIREQARERAAQRRAEDAEAGTSTALVIVGIEERVAAKFGKARYGSRRVNTAYCATGRADGSYAGSRADLSGGRTKQFANRKQIGG